MVRLDVPKSFLKTLTSTISQWMNSMFWPCHILPVLSLLKVYPHTFRTTLYKVIIELIISSKSHHKLRYPKWKFITPINLLEMIDFTISLVNFLHVFVLNGIRDIWHAEKTTLYLKQMRMRESLLLVQ